MSNQNRSSIQSILGRTTYQTLPDIPVDVFPLTYTTPNVSNRLVFSTANLAPVTITNFTAGAIGQTIRILGDGQTTIQNNTSIKNNTGADKLLAVNKVYTYTLFGSTWIENA